MATVEINGVKFTPVEGVKYRNDYVDIALNHVPNRPKDLEPDIDWEGSIYRALIERDTFFTVYFVLKIPNSNHPFVVQACREVDTGPQSHTLDLWAREHFKSSIITTAEIIKRICRNPEERIAIFSYSQKAALAHLRGIKQVFETSDLIKACFPDRVWQNPNTDAFKWSEDSGLYMRRRGVSKEATLEAWSLMDGMPTGKHFSGRVYDDVETPDMVTNPEMLEKLKQSFDMSQNLGTVDGWHRVVGTPYHHEGLLSYLKNKKRSDGSQVYVVREKPATVDGTPNGASVYLPEPRLAELRANRQAFYSQQLLDPTPYGTQKLDPEKLQDIDVDKIPQRLFKFMPIDPAGVRHDKREGDSWAMGVLGFEPCLDELGAANLYILDLLIEPLSESDALDEVVKMYIRNGVVLKLGVEKVGMMTAEIHISNALRTKGRHLTVENGGLQILRPAGRAKEQRIEQNVAWPLNNGKIFISKAIPNAYRERLRLEMQKFPYWRDDGLDMLAYGYDMAKDFKFNRRLYSVSEVGRQKYTPRHERRSNWMVQ